MTLALAALAYGITVAALVLLTIRVRQLLSVYKKGQPDPTRSGDRGARLKNMLTEVLGHTKMLNFTGTGIAHWFVMIGFGALFGTLVTAYGQILNPDFALPFIGHFATYELVTEFIGWATGIGIVTLIGIRQVTRIKKSGRSSRFYGSGSWKAYYVEATILVIVFCVTALRGLEGALSEYTSWNWHFGLTWPIAEMFKSMTLDQLHMWVQIVATIKIVVSMTWFIVIASNLTMGIAWHRFLAFFNIYYKRNADGGHSLGNLPELLSHGKPVDFEDPADDDVFGLGTRGDITWKGLLDMTSCTECGRCQSQCPAWHTDKPLSPKLLIMAMRDHAFAKTVETENMVGEGAPISLDVLWSCTTCGACVNECPVDIEHIDHIVNMRRFQVLVESEFPSQLNGTFRNLETAGNPWGSNKNDREGWISEMDFPIRVVEGTLPEDVEYLFWVGCAGSFDDRAKKTTKAFAELMQLSHINFRILGTEERCTGDPARRSGNEYLATMLTTMNVETMNAYNVKTIVTTCPHCFNTLKNDYPQFGGHYEVMHHTQYIKDLIESGRLSIDADKASLSKNAIAYHDSCYLGRYNEEYEAPRALLENVPGLSILEPARSKDRGLCCGAGGGRMFMEEMVGDRVNITRTNELLETGASTIAVNCPFCSTMITDGVKAADRVDQVQVKDISEILLESVKRH